MTTQMEAVAALAQRRLRPFTVLTTPDTYEFAAHIELLIEYLEALERGDILKLMVFMPPQNGKSTVVSQRFPAWYLGRHPSEHVILGSYGQELASRNGRIVRSLLQSDFWPFTVSMAEDSRAAHRWSTSAGGGLLAVGVGGGITGNPGNLIVVDDPVKDRAEADSPLMRERAWDWWTDAIQTRRAPQARELVTLTRWHEDDLAGRILNSDDAGDWTVLSLPALAEEDDQLGRQVGEPLWPARYPLSWLEGVKRNMPPRSWSALYQQRPTAETGNIIRREWIQHYASLPPDRVDETGKPLPSPWRVVQTIDSSWGEGVGNDPSAIATWGTDGIDYFLLDYWVAQVEFPDLRAQVSARFQSQRWRPTYIFVEDAANGRPLIQELRRTRVTLPDGSTVGLPIVPIHPEGSKPARLEATTPLWLSGHVWLPPHAEWLQPWIDQHLRFPYDVHDEGPDTTSMALLTLAPHLMQGVGLTISVGDSQRQPETHARQRVREIEAQRRRPPYRPGERQVTQGPRRLPG